MVAVESSTVNEITVKSITLWNAGRLQFYAFPSCDIVWHVVWSHSMITLFQIAIWATQYAEIIQTEIHMHRKQNVLGNQNLYLAIKAKNILVKLQKWCWTWLNRSTSWWSIFLHLVIIPTKEIPLETHLIRWIYIRDSLKKEE